MSNKKNPLFISTIALAIFVAMLLILIVLMVFYSCNICYYPYSGPDCNCGIPDPIPGLP